MTTKSTRFRFLTHFTLKQLHDMISFGILDNVQLTFIAERIGEFDSFDVLIDEILLNLIRHENITVIEGALLGVDARLNYRASHYNEFIAAGHTEDSMRHMKCALRIAVHNLFSYPNKAINDIAFAVHNDHRDIIPVV